MLVWQVLEPALQPETGSFKENIFLRFSESHVFDVCCLCVENVRPPLLCVFQIVGIVRFPSRVCVYSERDGMVPFGEHDP